MSNNKDRHNILKHLYKECNKEHHEVKGFEAEELIRELRLEIADGVAILHEFIDKEYITRSQDLIYIDVKGVCAFKDKTYLNKLWYRSWSNWLAIVAMIISIIALFRP